MKKISILLVIAVFFTTSSFAQVVLPENPKISVEGKSEVKLLPEELWFNVNMSAKNDDYKTCADMAVQKLAKIKSLFKENDIDEKLIKTQNYSIREVQKYDPETRKQVFDGYEATIPLTVRTKRNYEKNDLIFKLIKDNLESNFNLNFSLSEDQIKKAKEKLITLAVEDAKEKAGFIVKASGIKLGKINYIQYGEPNIIGNYNQPNLRTAGALMKMEADSEIVDLLEPDEISMGTRIVITWSVSE